MELKYSPLLIYWILGTLAILAAAITYWWLALRATDLRGLPKPIEENWVEVDGVSLHYWRSGKGPEVVLLHGIGANVQTWRFLIPLLSPFFTLTAFDLPGFGRSTKDPKRDHGLDEQSRLVWQAIQKLQIHKPVIVGSSMGGAIALWMGKLAPQMTKAVIVLAPSANATLLPFRISEISRLMLGAHLFVNSFLIRQIMNRIYYRKSELVTDETVKIYERPFLEDKNAVKTFVKATAVISDKRLPQAFRDYPLDVLILYGVHDKMVPRSVMKSLMSELPKYSYQEHHECGHHPMEDQPEWVAEQIRHFLKNDS